MASSPQPVASPADRIRAPVENGEILSVPPLADAVSLAQRNRTSLAGEDFQLAGRPLHEFRDWTRRVCLIASQRWMERALGAQATPPGDGPLFVTGHQPQLFHPGVWVKNWAIAACAEQSSGGALNLIVDNDLVETTAIALPLADAAPGALASIPYDIRQPRQPWEERRAAEPELLASFADRVEQAISPWGIQPILSDVWPAGIEAWERTGRIADALSAARIAQERRWAIRNLELPISELCQTEPFLAFAAVLFHQHERLLTSYNQAVLDYRRRYRIRNRFHPVPDLERRGEFFEAPFWFWRPGDHDRQKVFVRRVDSQTVEVHDERNLLCRLDGTADDVPRLQELQSTGRLRTRALTTTLFSRLCLADLFVHGIGGARYDEITDQLLETFIGITAPRFLTLTATLRLPLPVETGQGGGPEFWKQLLRELRFNADRVLDRNHNAVEHLADQKQTLIEQARQVRSESVSPREFAARREERRRAYQKLKAVQSELAARAQGAVQAAQEELRQATQASQADTILKSREYPGMAFPLSVLEELLFRVGDDVASGVRRALLAAGSGDENR